MAALKLFISHSSRLRPADAGDDQAQRNWQLLQATCKTLKDAYREKIEILVDHAGLHPGDDWEHAPQRMAGRVPRGDHPFLAGGRSRHRTGSGRKRPSSVGGRRSIPGSSCFPVLLPPMTVAGLDADSYFCS
jgi:hypothetical protein